MPDTNEIHVQKPVKSDRIIRAGDDKNIDSALMETEAQVLQHQQDRAIQLRLEELGITDKSFSVQMPVGSVPATDSPVPVVGSRLSWKRTLILAAVALLIAVATLIWLVVGNGTNHSQFSLVVEPSAARPASPPAPSPFVSGVVKSVPTTVQTSVVAPEALDNTETQVRELVEGWRLAWQQRDINAYLQYYSPLFAPPNGQTRSNWRKERQRKLSISSSIRLELKNIRIHPVTKNKVEVTFLQDYSSDTHQEKAVTKTLLIERTGEKWLIVGEAQKGK